MSAKHVGRPGVSVFATLVWAGTDSWKLEVVISIMSSDPWWGGGGFKAGLEFRRLYWDLLESGGRSELGCVFAVVVQSPSCLRLFATPWTAAHQASLSFIISWSLPKFMPIVISSSGCPLLLLPSVLPIIRDFSSESAVRIRWPKYWICFGRLKKLEAREPISPSRIESWGSLAVTTPCSLAWAQPGAGLSLGNQQVLLLPLSETLLLRHH